MNWQVKETTQSTVESPHVDLKRVVTIVRSSGYRGYLPIETLRMGRKEYDSFIAATTLLAQLRRALDEVPEA